MSDDLPKRLLDRARDAVHRPDAEDDWTQIYPGCIEGDPDSILRRAIAAALRELATSSGLDYLNGGDLQDIADEVERAGS